MVWATWAGGSAIVLGMACSVGVRLSSRERAERGSFGGLVIAVLVGIGYGLFFWLVGVVAWSLLQTALGDQVGPSLLALIGAGVGAILGCVLGWIVRRRSNRLRQFRWPMLGALAALGLTLVILYLTRTGPRDLDLYPDRATSPYRLPWPAGITRLCIQGNRAVISHRGWSEFAYDFPMPVDSDVCAARAGEVIQVEVSYHGRGLDAPSNYVCVRHADGTVAWYAHLRQNGSYVEFGQRVRQGERIAASGNVGFSTLPHLHFHVTDQFDKLVRVTFADVECDGGIPRMYRRYTSGNSMGEDPR
jgi:hypothetical protein